MKNIKRLRSVIHSTAHHAVSALCYMHPHLCEHCSNARLRVIKLNLFTGEYQPSFEKTSTELTLSTNGLVEKFAELLEVEGVNSKDISTAYAEFKCGKDNWPEHCVISVQTKEGKPLEVAVSAMGEVGKILGKYS
jgi:hypothetical protein